MEPPAKRARRAAPGNEKKPDIVPSSSSSSRPPLLSWKPERYTGWTAVSRVSRLVGRTRFVAARTPLSSIYELHFDEAHQFSVDMLVERQRSRGSPLGLVVNVTPGAKARYFFDVQGLDEWDIDYLPLDGNADVDSDKTHLLPPSPAAMDRFVKTCRSFWSQFPTRGIAVVSTFGLNRAGTLICCFLVEELGLSLKQALQAFADARPPGVYSRRCVDALFTRYRCKEPIPLPKPPAWDSSALLDEKERAARKVSRGENAAAVKPPPPGPRWRMEFSKRMGRAYWFDTITGKSVWEEPEELKHKT